MHTVLRYNGIQNAEAYRNAEVAGRKGFMMKIRIGIMLLLLAVLGTAFTGCNEKEEEDNLELVWELESDKGQDTYV